jgi:ABC-2 type transport system permease protein
MLQRIWTLIQKETIQLLRMPIIYIGMTFATILELILFATAVHSDVKHIPIIVCDQSRSSASNSYLRAFTLSGYFDILALVLDQAQVIQAIDSGQVSMGIVIPPDFADGLQKHQANVLLLVDGSNSFVMQAASAYANTISQQYAISLIQRPQNSINTFLQILYNPDLKDVWFLVPGLGAFLLYGIALKLTAFTIVREREMGTIEALLVTPLRPIELMIGKMVPNLVLAILNLVMTFAVGIFVFGVPFRGSLLLFAGLAILFATGSLGLGLAISSISQSQVQANQIASLMNIAVMFVSGFLFPVGALPLVLRIFGYVMPMTFFMPIVNGIMIKGVGLENLWVPSLALVVLTVLIFGLGSRLFRQSLD